MITWKRLCQRLRSSKPKKGMVVFCFSLISQFFLAYIAKHVGHMLAHDAARCGARPQENNSTSCATLEWTVRDEPYLKKMKPNDPAGVLYDTPVFTGSEFGTQSNPEKNVPINYVQSVRSHRLIPSLCWPTSIQLLPRWRLRCQQTLLASIPATISLRWT